MNWLPLLLAQGERISRREALERLRQGFHSELASNELFVYVVGALALIALALLLSQAITRHRPAKHPARRDHLAEAIKVLGLTREERADIVEVAARSRLPQPGAMLLSPANLAYALSRAPVDGPAGPLRNRLDALSFKLFGEGLPGDPKRVSPPAGQSISSSASGNQPV